MEPIPAQTSLEIEPARYRARSGWLECLFGVYISAVVLFSAVMLVFAAACCLTGGFVSKTGDTVPRLAEMISSYRSAVFVSVILVVLACLMARNCLLGLPMIIAALCGIVLLALMTWKLYALNAFLPGWGKAGVIIAKTSLGVSFLWVAVLVLAMAVMFLAWIGVHVYQGYYNLRLKLRRRR